VDAPKWLPGVWKTRKGMNYFASLLLRNMIHCLFILKKLVDDWEMACLRYRQMLTATAAPTRIAAPNATPIHTPNDTPEDTPIAELQVGPVNPAAQLHTKLPLDEVVQVPPLSQGGLQKEAARGLLQSAP
jgi:hypothetical protein